MGAECGDTRGELSDDDVLSYRTLSGAGKAEVEIDEIVQKIEVWCNVKPSAMVFGRLGSLHFSILRRNDDLAGVGFRVWDEFYRCPEDLADYTFQVWVENVMRLCTSHLRIFHSSFYSRLYIPGQFKAIVQTSIPA